MHTIKYICDKCNRGDCILIVEDEADVPDWCPYDVREQVNWRLKNDD